jgi:hypothetical protein
VLLITENFRMLMQKPPHPCIHLTRAQPSRLTSSPSSCSIDSRGNEMAVTF